MQELSQLGIDDFIMDSKDLADKKTRHQKKQEKIQRLKHDMQDPQMKRKRHQVRRGQEKNKLQRQLKGMTEEEKRAFLDAKYQKKIQAKQNILNALKNGQQVYIDMVYEKDMTEKENKSLAIQIELIMKSIRHLKYPPGIQLCSVGGSTEKQLQKMAYHYWTLKSNAQDIIEVSKMQGKKLVYLSPDAPKALQTVEEDTAYVIGGLVDRTIIKDASYIRAQKLKIQARHLPIRDFMKGRSCLNLDHVAVILGKFKQCQNWQEAFEYGAPKRWRKTQDQFGLRKVNLSDYEYDQQQRLSLEAKYENSDDEVSKSEKVEEKQKQQQSQKQERCLVNLNQ